MPAAFRRRLAEERVGRLVVTPLDGCLACFPEHEWQRLEARLRELPPPRKAVKAATRLRASRAVDCSLDRQGRILIPPALRAVAGLGRGVVLVGVLDRFEIWDPQAWEAFVRDAERVLDDAALELDGAGPAALRERAESPHPQEKPRR